MAYPADILLSTASITYNSVTMPETKGGVEITYSKEIKEKTSDTHGSTPLGAWLTGERLEITAQFAETSIDALKTAIDTATKTTGATKDQLEFGTTAGTSLSDAALVITPAQNNDLAITVHKAIVISEPTLMFKSDEENVYEVKWLGIIDTSKDDGKRLAQIGTSD